MLRFLFWLVFYIVTLGLCDIDVTYTDGLHIQFHGWPGVLKRKLSPRP